MARSGKRAGMDRRRARAARATGCAPAAWIVEHPADWSADGAAAISHVARRRRDGAVTFVADRELTAGLRIKAEQATLDATPQGLLADRSAIAALLLAEIGAGTTMMRRAQGSDRR